MFFLVLHFIIFLEIDIFEIEYESCCIDTNDFKILNKLLEILKLQNHNGHWVLKYSLCVCI